MTAAFAVAVIWIVPAPFSDGWLIRGMGPVPAHAGSPTYRPDGPPTPPANKAPADAKAKPKADLGTPVTDLPPASEIGPKGVSPAIADLLKYGANAGSMESASTTSGSISANTIGPIKAVAVAPWVVEPKLPPQDIIVVEGETSQFNQAVNMGEWLDYFFNDERLEDEINYTRLRIRGNAFFQDGKGVKLKPNVNVKVSVPGLERRLLVFLNGDMDNNGFGEDGAVGGDRLDPEKEDNALLGLQAFLNATRSFNVSIRGGVRFRKGTPVLFAGPRYRQLFDLNPWAMRITARARWFTDEGLTTRTYVDFDRRFSDGLFLRITPSVNWSEQTEDLKYAVSAGLYQRISLNAVLRYSALALFDTDTPDSLVNARLRVAWRQRIIRDWLVIELAPEITFPAERNYHPVWGVLVRLETTFDVHMPWWNH